MMITDMSRFRRCNDCRDHMIGIIEGPMEPPRIRCLGCAEEYEKYNEQQNAEAS